MPVRLCFLVLAAYSLPAPALLQRQTSSNASELDHPQRTCPGAPSPANPSVAIVLLTRRPADLKTWLQYHLYHMEVKHVFMSVEDTPDFDETWQSVPKAIRDRVTIWKAAPLTLSEISDNYSTLQARQRRAMMRAKDACKQMGIGWLLHIDDDELLYSPRQQPIGKILASKTGFDQVKIPNVEAVYSSSAVKNCFAETTTVNLNPHSFAAYVNDKAAIRVGVDAAVPLGPHSWHTADGHKLCSIELERKHAPQPELLLVHFESCPFTHWEDKFRELGKMSPAKINKMPFAFYQESASRMQRCGERKAAGEMFLETLWEECSQASLKKLWIRWKTSRNQRIKPESLMPISIPWKNIETLSLAAVGRES